MRRGRINRSSDFGQSKETALVVLLILLGALVRLHLLLVSPNLFSGEAEAYSKLQLTLKWSQAPWGYPDLNFGPLHLLILALPWKLTGSLLWANRIVACALGVGLLPIFWLLARRLFGPVAAAGALGFFALSALPVKVSAATVAEGPALFSLILGLLLIFVYVDSERKRIRFLLGAAAAFAAMTALRFETWLFLPLIPLWLLLHRDFRGAVLIGALLAVFPVIHLSMAFKSTGNPFDFLRVSGAATSIHLAMAPLGDRALGFVKALAHTCSWGTVALGAAGLVMALTTRKGALAALMFLVIFGTYEYKAISATLEPTLYRYLTIPSALLSLFWVLPAQAVLRRSARGRRTAMPIMLAAIGLGLGVWSYQAVTVENERQELSRGAIATMRELRPSLSPADRIFVGGSHHPIMVVESGLMPNNFREAGLGASMETIGDTFREWRPTLVILNNQYPNLSSLRMRNPCAAEHDLFGIRYCRAGFSGKWCWFKNCEGW